MAVIHDVRIMMQEYDRDIIKPLLCFILPYEKSKLLLRIFQEYTFVNFLFIYTDGENINIEITPYSSILRWKDICKLHIF
jgi:hypothetical protein